jgi:hypothetical protein
MRDQGLPSRHAGVLHEPGIQPKSTPTMRALVERVERGRHVQLSVSCAPALTASVAECGNHDTRGAKLKGRVEGAWAWRDAAPGAGLRSGIEGLMA